MSEELIQRDLLTSPEKMGEWFFYNIGSTTINALKKNKIIPDKTYESKINRKKPDGLITLNRQVIAVIENKTPDELKTKKLQDKAIKQEFYVAKALNANLLIVTDKINTTFWINPHNGDKIIDENGHELALTFNQNNRVVIETIKKVIRSISETNSKLISTKYQDPSPLARQVWQDLWSVSGATPENCLYTFVEVFIFKYLSDLSILTGMYSFDNLLKQYHVNTVGEVLEYYASTIRPKIKEKFPYNNKDNTTIINGTIFVSKDDKAIEGYSSTFKTILERFQKFGKLENINYDFKSKLFESFLKESISISKWGQYFTPLKVVQAISKAIEIKENMKICDPACGVGKFLLEPIKKDISKFFKVEDGILKKKIELVGLDKGFSNDEQKTIILAKANMLIYFSDLIGQNKTITKQFSDLFNETFTLKTNSILGTLKDPVENEYDLILTNPPYVMNGSKQLKDEIDRSGLSTKYPIKASGIESLFMEWIVNALKVDGKAFVIVPDGIMNRISDKKLRDFIMKKCTVDAIISLPLNTFFSTNKKTFILVLTKKEDETIAQVVPIFTYLVSDIGETLDVYRFDTNSNHLDDAINLFNQFKYAKNFFATDDSRCKVISFEDFSQKQDWIVDNLWSKEEKIDLGIEKETNIISIEEFPNTLESISENILSFKDEILELNEKKKSITNFKKFKVNELFEAHVGPVKYTKKYGNINKGNYPVFAASNINKLTTINTYDFDGDYLTWARNGFAGYMKVLSGKFSINSDRGILIPKLDLINTEYVKFMIEPILRNISIGRKGENNKDEFTKVYPSMILEVEIPFPLNNNKIDEEIQELIVEKNKKIEEVKKKINKYQNDIKDIQISFDNEYSFVELLVSDIFTIIKGKSKYTNEYIKDNKGSYPVYSSQTTDDGMIGRISTFDLEEECLTWTTDGANAGTIFKRNGKFSMTTHCGALIQKENFSNQFSLEYIYHYLKSNLKHYAIGEQNKRVTLSIIKDLKIKMPVSNSNEIDLFAQTELALKYTTIEQIKNSIVNELNNIINLQVKI